MSTTEDKILDATLAEAADVGVAGVRIAAIAERAQVGAGTLYRYYSSKELLLDGLYAREKRAAHAAAMAGYDESMKLKVGLRLVWANWIRDRLDYPARASFLDQYSTSPTMGAETRAAGDAVLLDYVGMYQRAEGQGEVRPLSPTVALILMLAPPASFANSVQSGAVDDFDAELDLLFATTWDGIKA